MKKVIEVTERDIQRSKGLLKWQVSAYCCPIALAVRRAFRKTWAIGPTYIACDRGRTIGLPRKAQTFISRFDDGKSVKPIRFEVEA